MADEDGVYLALSAQNEVLTKMNTVLEKMLSKQEEEDEEEEEKKLKEMKKAEREGLISEIMKAIEDKFVLKQEVSSDAKGEDAKTEKLDTKPGDIQHPKQQEVIQAAEDDKERKKEVEKQEEKDEKEDEEDKEYPEVEKLKKEITDLKKSMDQAVEEEIDARMRRMGWKQEKGLAAPKRIEIGADEPMLKKGKEKEFTIEERAKLDYATLKRMEAEAEYESLDPSYKQLLS